MGSRKDNYMDYSLIFIVLFLLAFGLVMLYSTSAYEAGIQFGDSTYYFRHQLIPTLAGVIVMFVLSFLPYGWLQKIPWLAYGAALFLVVLVKSPLGWSANGANRWIRIFGISIQPAEVAKVAMIIFLASFIINNRKFIETPKGFWVVLASTVPMCLAVYGITRNLSSAVIIFGIAFLMLFVATKGYLRFFALLGFGLVAVFGIVTYVQKAGSQGNFRFGRILAWLDPEAYASGKGFQTLQSLYAIGSGGLFGKGLGESMQKLGFIPEAQNDMIFSIICEELGLFGAFSVMLMFLLLLWRMMIIALNAPDLYGAMLVVGVMGHLSIQVILNIAVVTNTIPNTGITLPFISYGGSAVLLLLAEVGIVLSVARRIVY
ncbi:MAG: cell division protein FtsW [Butyrivibrio sp.]|nr:cell division protein FtsW [Butyrivibrio sp.]